MAIVTLEKLNGGARKSFEKGVSALERDNLDYAIDIFTNLIETDPNFFQGRHLLRMAEIKKFKQKNGGQLAHSISSITGIGGVLAINGTMKKNPLKALLKAEKLLHSDPLNKQFLDLHAKVAIAAEMPEVAVHSISTAHEHYPKDKAILKRLAKLYEEVGQTDKAKDAFEKLMETDPDNPEYIKSYKDAAARDTLSAGGWEEATDYRDLIKDKDKAQELEQDAKAVKTEKDVNHLIAVTELKAKQDPENVNYKRALADLYAKDCRFEDAITLLNEAQKLTGGGDPQIDRAITDTNIEYFGHQIAELKKSGDEAGAKQKEVERESFVFNNTLDRIKRYPNDLLIKFEYGVLLYERGNTTEAVQQFQQAQRNPQKRIPALYYMARCFKAKEQYDIAAEQLEKAASELHVMDDQKKDIIYELGEIYEAIGNVQKATGYYKDIYSVDIGYREVAAKIENIYKSKKDE